MKEQKLKGILIVPVLIALAFFLTACSQKEQATEEKPIADQVGSTILTTEKIVFTKADPGPWSGKEGGHVPIISYKKTETGLSVNVSVSHEMNSETPHYIEWIRLFNGKGDLVGEKDFEAEDEKAMAVFILETVPDALKAYAKCNLHGIWMAEGDVTLDL